MKKILEHLKSEWYKYVIEIIVITAGILGAFALNTWNENHKSRVAEIKFYQEMKGDLQANLEEINHIKRDLRYSHAMIDSLVIYLDKDLPFDNQFKYYLERYASISIFNNAISAYQFMQSSGSSLITNDSLRLMITNLYEKGLYNISTRERRMQGYEDKTVTPFIEKNFEYGDNAKQSGRQRLNTPLNFGELKKSPIFKNVMLGYQNKINIRLRSLPRTEVRINELIQKIDEEIQKLD